MRYKCVIKEAVLASDLEFNDDLAKYLCKKTLTAFGKLGGNGIVIVTLLLLTVLTRKLAQKMF